MWDYIELLIRALNGTDTTELDRLLLEMHSMKARRSTLYVAGNGGSYAVALHWGVDLQKAANLRTYTLGSNGALTTALSNDLDYAMALSTELSMTAMPGDVLVCLSCSGRSRNIVSLIGEAAKMGLARYLITSESAPTYMGVHTVRIPTTDYGVLEDIFSVVGHSLTKALL